MAGKAGKAAFSLLMMALLGWPLAAQELSISYLEGRVSQKVGSSWQDLSIGDTIPSDSTVMIDPRACLELSAGGVRITLTQPGTYGMKKILSASMSLQSTGAAKALTTKLLKLVLEPARKESSAGGARAEVIDRGQIAGLMDDDTNTFLSAGKDLIGSGDFDKAVVQLTKAVDSAADDQIAEAQFYLAEACSLKGETRNALAQAAAVTGQRCRLVPGLRSPERKDPPRLLRLRSGGRVAGRKRQRCGRQRRANADVLLPAGPGVRRRGERRERKAVPGAGRGGLERQRARDGGGEVAAGPVDPPAARQLYPRVSFH